MIEKITLEFQTESQDTAMEELGASLVDAGDLEISINGRSSQYTCVDMKLSKVHSLLPVFNCVANLILSANNKPECEHTAGVMTNGELISMPTAQTFIAKRYKIEDYTPFKFCPKCGEKL